MLDRKQKIILIISTAVALFFLAGNFLATRLDSQTPFRPLAIFGEVVSHVNRDYVEDVDAAKAMNGAYVGFLEGLDPECDYLDKEEAIRYPRVVKQAVTAAVVVTKRVGYGYILRVEPGSAAERAGLKRGDFIRAINHRSTRDMGWFQIQTVLLGKPPVECAVIRDSWRNGPQTIVLSGPEASVNPPATMTVRDNVSVWTLGRVQEGAAATLRAAGPHPLIIDLRGATGLDYEEAVRCLSLLLPGGDLAVRHEHGGKEITRKDEASGHTPRPKTAVLIDGFTSHAAELIAASLKQRQAGKLFGSRTFGAAREQRLFPFSDGTGVLLSAYDWTAPGGPVISGKGVEPDVAVEPPAEGQKTDPVLDAAMAYLREGTS